MHKLMASAHKEFLLLIRDIGGIAILFIMPLVLIVTITLIQDSTFKTVADTKIPILVVNNDQGTVSETILEGLKDSNAFEVILENTEEAAKNLVFKGAYQLAIVIPENLSSGLEQKVAQNVDGIISKFGLEEETDSLTKIPVESKEVKLYFDPATQVSFKSSVKNGIDKMVSKIETQSIYKA
ncbi:MAG: ABC transporter permease, partial [Xanthomarina gelatinilytica]|nr:ABC transporter permease [Xanthomarina gelatinilytica]